MNDLALTERDVEELDDLCEGCGEWKPCVARVKYWRRHEDVKKRSVLEWLQKLKIRRK